MAEEALKITITADNKQALAAMSQTVKSLDSVDKAVGATGGKVVKMGKDFTGLSRVIQDLPYGFNAIANNLTNILPAAGALGLGISALVAGLQFAQLGFGAWTRGLGESKKATEDAAKANEEYLQSIAKEKTQLDLLFRTASNANLPMGARVDAIKTLRNEMGAYLQDVTDEELLAGKAAGAYEKLSEAIIKSARARAASSLIEKKQLKKLELEQEIAAEESIKQQTKANAKPYVTQTTMGAVGEVRTIEKQHAAADAAFISRTKDKVAAIKVLDAEMAKLGVTYDENVIKPLKIDEEQQQKLKKIQEEKEAAAKKARQAEKAYQKELSDWYDKHFAFEAKMRDELKKRMVEDGILTRPEQLKKNQEDFTKKINNTKVLYGAYAAINQVTAANNAVTEEQNKTQDLSNNLTNVAINSLNGLFTAMQNGQSMGEALGNMFKRLAIDIALAAAKAAIFQSIMMILNPTKAGKFGAGFLKGFGSLLGFSEGGTVSGPKSGYPVMLHGTEHIVRPDQMRSIIASASQMGGGNSRIVVEGRISGQDIWLSQQRTNTFRALTT